MVSFGHCENLVRVGPCACPPRRLGFGLAVVDILDAEPRAADVLDFGDDPTEAAELTGRNRHRDWDF